MSQVLIPNTIKWSNSERAPLLSSIYRKLVFKTLNKINTGSLTIIEGDNQYVFGNQQDDHQLSVNINVIHPGFYKAVILGGELGAADAYIQSYWSTTNLTQLMQLILKNKAANHKLNSRLIQFIKPLSRIAHWLKRNTIDNARRNITSHYDIGNDLFEFMLDDSLNYSSGIYPLPDSTLAEAQYTKMDRICRKLNLTSKDHLLEIGTGWGGFAIHAATYYGCKITTTTISDQQYHLASKRIYDLGLNDKITIIQDDYRKLNGQYDKLVSIEMIEAVGHEYLPTYFNKCSSLLKPDGLMMIQAINMNDHRYKQYLKTVDFIQRYVFPGGCCPSIGAISNAVAQTGNLSIVEIKNIGPHYARTLKDWRDNFNTHLEAIKNADYSDQFIRLWTYYLCYCEAGFKERYIHDTQILLTKPNHHF